MVYAKVNYYKLARDLTTITGQMKSLTVKYSCLLTLLCEVKGGKRNEGLNVTSREK